MSARNFFIIHKQDMNQLSGLDEITNELVELATIENFEIYFNVRDYHDELLEILNINDDYFCISNNFTCIETDNLFDIYNCYEAIKRLTKKEKYFGFKTQKIEIKI